MVSVDIVENGVAFGKVIVDDPIPGPSAASGSPWTQYHYRYLVQDDVKMEGELHALPDEGVAMLLERVFLCIRRNTLDVENPAAV